MDRIITRITMVRHGETHWNKIERMQGQLDSNLTELGIKQASAVANALKKIKYDAFYSSDLKRAMQTSEIISKQLGLTVIKENCLREINLGIAQGLTAEEFKDRYPDEYIKYASKDPDYVIPDGESNREKYNRAVGCLSELAQRHKGGNILIVTHGGILDSIIRMVFDIPLSVKRHFSLINASINVFNVADGKWMLETWGNISHLNDIPASDDF